MREKDELLLSDLSTPDGADWRAFCDRVMGGISQEQATIEQIGGRRCLRLRGAVRIENNGGFVQVALPLGQGGLPLDAQTYTSDRLLV